MRNNTLGFVRLTLIVLGLSLLGSRSESAGAIATSPPTVANTPPHEDVIARVGDQVIRFTELNTMLNSSAMVGLSIPALGTPERNKVIITLLDKAISANLLYLDAKEQGTDRREPYTTDIRNFEDAVLATMYRQEVLIGDIPVSEAEVQDFYTTSIRPETELTDDVKLAIEAKLRQQKLDQRKATLRERLRADVDVKINDEVLGTDYDSNRSDADVVATLALPGSEVRPIRWSDVSTIMRGADYRAKLAEFYIDNDGERVQRLQIHIDNTLMAEKARAAGMEQDPEFVQRTTEYRKTRLINVHRTELIKGWTPSDEELQGWYLEHMDSIAVPETRKVQMVVVKTKQEAEDIKAQIDSGKLTMFQAAQQYSLDPNAKTTLGDMGWVSQGTGYPELDDFTFSLDPDVVAGPVESPTGWHLVKVLDVTDAQFQDIADPATRKHTLRMYLKDRLNNYLVELRKNRFKVAVYDDELTRQFQKQADYIAQLNKKAVQEGSVTKQRQKELDKWITPPQD